MPIYTLLSETNFISIKSLLNFVKNYISIAYLSYPTIIPKKRSSLLFYEKEMKTHGKEKKLKISLDR